MEVDKKLLTVNEWLIIQAKYEKGERVADLAKEYGVRPNTISVKASKKGWKKRGSLIDEAVSEARSAVKKSIINSWTADLLVGIDEQRKYNSAMRAALGKLIKRLHSEIDSSPSKKELPRLTALLKTLTDSLTALNKDDRDLNKHGDFDPISDDTEDGTKERLIAILETGKEQYSEEMNGENQETTLYANPTFGE